MAVTVSLNSTLLAEYNNIPAVSFANYSGYRLIASSLKKVPLSDAIVAGLVGCIIPESGTNWKILNKQEYNGKGASGTEGWNCGEGLIQWTFWKYKINYIKTYNANPKSTQKLPTTWAVYKQGSPHLEGGSLVADTDGKHIAGLSLDNQMIFLYSYYKDVLDGLASCNNLAVICAKIYQRKAGIGFYTNINDPVLRAYTTAKNKYPSTYNHFLKSVKYAQLYMGSPVDANYVPTADDYAGLVDTKATVASTYIVEAGPNKVYQLSAGTAKKNAINLGDERKKAFSSLQESLKNNTPEMGRDMYLTSEMYDSNILKGTQQSKIENPPKKKKKT